MTAGNDVTASKNVTAIGDVTAGNDVTASKNVTAGKNVTASNDVTAGKNVTASGNVTAGGFLRLKDTVSGNYYKVEVTNGALVVTAL